ncbi:hypothetical protein GGR56DRAFT_549233 [Xylariaceae sp. FL0804]|nr:hypothetical protein GGR56DRAFT_549233 [Xylariaceae sp. FL0804]
MTPGPGCLGGINARRTPTVCSAHVLTFRSCHKTREYLTAGVGRTDWEDPRCPRCDQAAGRVGSVGSAALLDQIRRQSSTGRRKPLKTARGFIGSISACWPTFAGHPQRGTLDRPDVGRPRDAYLVYVLVCPGEPTRVIIFTGVLNRSTHPALQPQPADNVTVPCRRNRQGRTWHVFTYKRASPRSVRRPLLGLQGLDLPGPADGWGPEPYQKRKQNRNKQPHARQHTETGDNPTAARETGPPSDGWLAGLITIVECSVVRTQA